jgi:hypothetical protein
LGRAASIRSPQIALHLFGGGHIYATPYYFGCEADDRMNAVAFGKAMPLGARINEIYSSDIGHFDVVDMRDPLPEAFELVEDGLITESDFHDFVFGNAVRLWGQAEPALLRGHGGGQGSGGVVEAWCRDPARRCEIATNAGVSPACHLTLMAGPRPAMSIGGAGRTALPVRRRRVLREIHHSHHDPYMRRSTHGSEETDRVRVHSQAGATP